jgi:hypothetical protein
VELLLKKNPTFILKVSLFRRYLNIEVGKWNHLININLVLYTKNYLIKMKNEKKLLTEVLKEEKIVGVDKKLEKNNQLEFNNKLEVIKEKVNRLRKADKECYEMEGELKDLTNNFVNEFSNRKVELGKAVS